MAGEVVEVAQCGLARVGEGRVGRHGAEGGAVVGDTGGTAVDIKDCGAGFPGGAGALVDGLGAEQPGDVSRLFRIAWVV